MKLIIVLIITATATQDDSYEQTLLGRISSTPLNSSHELQSH